MARRQDMNCRFLAFNVSDFTSCHKSSLQFQNVLHTNVSDENIRMGNLQMFIQSIYGQWAIVKHISCNKKNKHFMCLILYIYLYTVQFSLSLFFVNLSCISLNFSWKSIHFPRWAFAQVHKKLDYWDTKRGLVLYYKNSYFSITKI